MDILALGKKIRLGGVSFEIIGELEKTGSFTPTGSLDQVIIMPSTTFQRILTRWTWNEFVLQTFNFNGSCCCNLKLFSSISS